MSNAVSASSPAPILEAIGLASGYGVVEAIHGVDISVSPGQMVTLLGANGAGKTTTLLTLSGELKPSAGEVRWKGAPSPQRLWKMAQSGLAYVTEERSVFMQMSVMDNLRVGKCDVDMALELFPELKPRLKVHAGLLSGGEQQMLSLGRALARRPEVLLADELSLGLAPLVVRRLLEAVRVATTTGIAALVVEQHARIALEYATDVYVMQRGRVVHSGTAQDVVANLDDIEARFLAPIG
jgi:branched-chain amino acid transport system ATP-binding protein